MEKQFTHTIIESCNCRYIGGFYKSEEAALGFYSSKEAAQLALEQFERNAKREMRRVNVDMAREHIKLSYRILPIVDRQTMW